MMVGRGMLSMARVLHVLAIIASASLGFSAGAQAKPVFELSVGLFPTTFSTSASLDSSEGVSGSEVDLEDEVGLKSKLSNLRAEGSWRFKPRHRLEFGYTYWNRSNERAIEREIAWGDAVFDVGAAVKLTNDARFVKLAYRFTLVETEKSELSLSGGVDSLFNKTTIEGEATVTGADGSVHRELYADKQDYVIPIPLFGADYQYRFTDDFSGRASGEYLQFSYSNTRTKVLDVRASVDYSFSDRWGAGLGYNYVGLDVERKRFEVSYHYQGAIIYMTFRTR